MASTFHVFNIIVRFKLLKKHYVPHGLIVVAHLVMTMSSLHISVTISVNTALHFLKKAKMSTGRNPGE